MDKGLAFVRFILFCIFFSVAAGAIALAVLATEVKNYYSSKIQYRQLLDTNENIQRLIDEYGVQIEQIKKDPDLLRKLEWITFGNRQGQTDEPPIPTAELQELSRASAALADQPLLKPNPSGIERWIERSSEPQKRQVLFMAGAGLLFITFIFFGKSQDGAAGNNSHGGHREHRD